MVARHLKKSGLLFSFFMVFTIVLAQDFRRERNMMVESQIRARGISDVNTLRAMRNVPRHLYIPYNQRNSAYDDRPLPIGYGQTISQPYIVAYMTEIINPTSGQKVLEIGTGSGYQAAVLAEIVDHVYTIEIVKPLGETAKTALVQNYNNVSVKIGDGYYGWEEHAPFDAIVVTAAAEYIPPPLIEQLKDGGRMVIPVGSPFRVQQLMLIEKKNGQISSRSLMPVRFVPFTGSR
jgi:protein-L-isoaspartate(D-aspartate) O-methyltransferase